MSLLEEVHGRNLLESVKGIPVIFPLPSHGDTKGVTDLDMGKHDPKTRNYINISTNTIPPGNEARIKEIEEMIDLTHRWLDIHAGRQTQIQRENGALPDDMSMDSKLKRSEYRIKVVDTIMTTGKCGWINFSHDSPMEYNLSVKKAEFHTGLLRDMLAGLTTVKGISESIEEVLESISRIIIQSKDQIQRKSVWTFFNVFSWDSVSKEVKGSIRIIWYQISAKMVEYNVNKASVEQIKMSFAFQQTDYTFVNGLWLGSKKRVLDFIQESNTADINQPINGEVKP